MRRIKDFQTAKFPFAEMFIKKNKTLTEIEMKFTGKPFRSFVTVSALMNFKQQEVKRADYFF